MYQQYTAKNPTRYGYCIYIATVFFNGTKTHLFSVFFVPNFVSGVASLSDTPRSSSWWRWIPLVKLLMLEKKLDEKYFFVMEKFYFGKKSMTKKIFPKKIFSPKISRKKSDFLQEKFDKKSDFFRKIFGFFVDFFLTKNLIFFLDFSKIFFVVKIFFSKIFFSKKKSYGFFSK